MPKDHQLLLNLLNSLPLSALPEAFELLQNLLKKHQRIEKLFKNETIDVYSSGKKIKTIPRYLIED